MFWNPVFLKSTSTAQLTSDTTSNCSPSPYLSMFFREILSKASHEDNTISLTDLWSILCNVEESVLFLEKYLKTLIVGLSSKSSLSIEWKNE